MLTSNYKTSLYLSPLYLFLFIFLLISLSLFFSFCFPFISSNLLCIAKIGHEFLRQKPLACVVDSTPYKIISRYSFLFERENLILNWDFFFDFLEVVEILFGGFCLILLLIVLLKYRALHCFVYL